MYLFYCISMIILGYLLSRSRAIVVASALNGHALGVAANTAYKSIDRLVDNTIAGWLWILTRTYLADTFSDCIVWLSDCAWIKQGRIDILTGVSHASQRFQYFKRDKNIGQNCYGISFLPVIFSTVIKWYTIRYPWILWWVTQAKRKYNELCSIIF